MSTRAARALLDRCWRRGLRVFDVAAAYGAAEERIGGWRTRSGRRPVLITKAPSLANVSDDDVAAVLARHAAASRSSLHVRVIDGYLLHDAADWQRASVRAALSALKERGQIRNVGVSAYNPETVHRCLDVQMMDLVQLPFGLFDQRAAEVGLLERAAETGLAVFARSVFLQGLLFRDPDDLPPFFASAAPVLRRIGDIAREAGCGLTSLAIQAALAPGGITSAVVGVYTPAQADAAADALGADVPDSAIEQARRIGRALPAKIRDPRGWPAPQV